MKLQAMFGTIPTVRGVGEKAEAVVEQVKTMRKILAADGLLSPRAPSSFGFHCRADPRAVSDSHADSTTTVFFRSQHESATD